jgi:plastocyanin
MKTILAALACLVALTAAAEAGEQVAASIKLFQFKSGRIEIKAGTTVEWVNGDDIEHSVTSGMPGKPSKDFDSGYFKKDGSFAFTFTKPGTYTYFCKRHPSMKAEVVVTE